MRVPEGHPKIAQRFIAGSAVRPPAPSPGGTADVTGLSPQSSLRDSLAKHRNLYPSDKSLGYYQSSLRDEIHRGAVLCDTTASRHPFSCLPSTCVEQRGALPQATVRRGLRPNEDRAHSTDTRHSHTDTTDTRHSDFRHKKCSTVSPVGVAQVGGIPLGFGVVVHQSARVPLDGDPGLCWFQPLGGSPNKTDSGLGQNNEAGRPGP